MTQVPIIFPLGGRSDRQAHHNQPPLTTRDARNMRSRDPVNGRVRGAQRSGYSKVFATQIASSGVGHDLCSISFDSGLTTYARKSSGSPVKEWEKQLPDTSNVEHSLDVDRQSNAYYTHGSSGIAKYNSANEVQWKIALPVDDPDHLVRSLHVDIADRIYAGVTTGGDQDTANLWCYEQLEDESEVLFQSILWTIRTGFYFEEIVTAENGLLYTLQNDDTKAKSYVIAYAAIDSTVPVEVLRASVPYPSRGLDVANDGSFYVASPEDDSPAVVAQTLTYVRGISPSSPAFRPSLAGSEFEDVISNYDTRKWGHYDLSDSSGLFTATGLLTEGAQITQVTDLTGNGRHLLATASTIPLGTAPSKGPTYSVTEINGMGSAFFDGNAGLYISPTAAPSTANRKSQKTLWPGYGSTSSEAGSWVTFIVMRIPPEATSRVLFQQMSDAGITRDLTLIANAKSDLTTSAGNIWWKGGTNPSPTGAGTSGRVLHYDYSTASQGTDCCLITIINDQAVSGTGTGAGSELVTRSIFRVNGLPVDRYGQGFRQNTTVGNHCCIGWDWLGGIAAGIFNFCEMLTLDRIDPSSTAEDLVIEHEKFGPNAYDITYAAQSANELTDIEGILMNKWGIAHLAPDDAATSAHPYGLITSGSVKFSSPPGATVADQEANKNYPLLAKYDRSGKLMWVYNTTTTNEVAADAGGVGLGVRIKEFEDDDEVHVYSVGVPTHTHDAVGEVGLRKVLDQGATFSDTFGDGAWHHKFQGNSAPSGRLRMDVDKYGSLYFPYQVPSSTDDHALEVFEKGPDGSGDAQLITFYQGNYVGQSGFAAHHDPDIPDYGDGQTINLAEFVYLAAETDGGSNLSAAVRLALVTVTQSTGNPRQVVNLVAANGDIKTFTVAGVVATPTGGSGALDSASEFVMCVPTLGEAIFLDGLSYMVYTARDGLVTNLEAKSSGAIIKRGRIGAFWRGRLVIGHFPENPGGWAMSAMGDIRDWDFFPPVVKSTSAVLGNLSRTKETPAVLTGLVPMNEDLLLLGAYNSIWRMTGDPQDGGQLDRISDSIGMAFGKPWAKDPEGRTFFFGLNPPGLYSIAQSGAIVNLTRNTLEDTEFASIDFSDKNVRLYWDPVERGIHIFQTPRTTLGTSVSHWFWEEKTADVVELPPVWTDTFQSTGAQPMAAGALEGDTVADRLFVVLGEDGYLRKVDATALDDDGSLIDAYFVTQIFSQELGAEAMLTETRVTLGDQQDGCDLELFANDNSEYMGQVKHYTRLRAGANHSFRKRVRGENIWLRLRNARSGERFAFSSGWADIEGLQMQRTK